MKYKHQFTLIEGIILILILIGFGILLLHALSVRRETARRISCVGNLKNIGLSMRMYSNVFKEAYPYPNGRTGLQLLANEGFLENTQVYVCSSTEDIIPDTKSIHKYASYAYAGGINEASSVDSAVSSDRSGNHTKYGNILFVDGHVKGYAGNDWISNAKSHLTDFN